MIMIDSTFKMEYKNIRMIRGDTLSFGVDVRDDKGALIDVESMALTVKSMENGSKYIFQKLLGNGITKDESGYIIRVAPEDTENEKAGKYLYDIQIGVNHDIFTLSHGLFEIEGDITRGEPMGSETETVASGFPLVKIATSSNTTVPIDVRNDIIASSDVNVPIDVRIDVKEKTE